MKRALLLGLVLCLLSSGVALASGSSRTSGPVTTHSTNPLLVTETLTCIVTALHPDGAVEVKDKKSGKVSKLHLRSAIRITAQSKKDFDGRKVLKAVDLKVGHVLKITHRPAANEIVKIKVLKVA